MADNVFQEVLARKRSSVVNTSEKKNNSELSQVGQPSERCPPMEFAKSMAYLSAMKRTASLTDLQMTAWHNVLGVFDVDIVNAAVLEIALTDNRFPEVGDLYQSCRRHALKAGRMKLSYPPSSSDKDEGRPQMSELREIGDRFGLPVWRPRGPT